MSGNKNAQVSTEMLLAAGFILLIFVVVFALTSKINAENVLKKDEAEKRTECVRLADVFSSVYISGTGTAFDSSTAFRVIIFEDRAIEVWAVGDAGKPATICYSQVPVKPAEFTGDFFVRLENSTVAAYDTLI